MHQLRSLFALFFTWAVFTCVNFDAISAIRVYDSKRLTELREEVLSVFYHGYNNYLDHAYPYDELRPLSCDGVDTWGSYSLTLIDALDTLAIVGNYSEFRRVAQLILDNAHFDMNINVSVFETNIRILGGLLSAHLLSQKAGMEVEPGWPCQGPLLRLAESVARRLLPAFDTPTGMPYGTVNLRFGVPPSETPVTCTAGVGTFLVEFGSLSRLTGDMIYEKVALRALRALYVRRSALDLVGNHIDTKTGKWTAIDAGIGAGVDSFFEYLVKGSILFQKPELMHMFRVFHRAIEKHLGKGGWYVWATMGQGHVSATTFQSLETFFPGMLSLVGEFKNGLKAITNYHRILKQYGGLPELYNILQGRATYQREGYPLRPELIESAMYLYRATGDPYMLEIGEDILHSIQHNARTECGYATIRDVTTLTLEDRMESFFLAETVKYLYLLFDPDNFIHNLGEDATVVSTPMGKCTLYVGGYIFNTEAHPIDPAALNCCTGIREADLHKEIEVIDEMRHAERKKERSTSNRNSKQKQKSSPQTKNENQSDVMPQSTSTIPSVDMDPPKLILNFDNSNLFNWDSPEVSVKTNPLLNFSHKQTPVFRRELKLDWGFNATGMKTITSESENIVFKLLKKLLEEQSGEKDAAAAAMAARKEIAAKVADQGGLQISGKSVSEEAKELRKLIENFETKNQQVETEEDADAKNEDIRTNKDIVSDKEQESKIIGKGTVVKQENRIRPTSPLAESEPDLDLIFGTSPTSRSLSFYFSLKWLPTFPDLLRQLIPSEGFDMQKFYTKIHEETSVVNYTRRYNISKDWWNDYDALRCPSFKMADRFMFFRSSIEE